MTGLNPRHLAPNTLFSSTAAPSSKAVAMYWIAPDGSFHFIGASAASTGKPGSFDHFITPTGIRQDGGDRQPGVQVAIGINWEGRRCVLG